MPSSFRSAPLASEAADHPGAQLAARMRAVQEPTLPKPWTTKSQSGRDRGRSSRRGLGEHAHHAAPGGRLAAAEPSSASGLPVTQAGVWPWSLPYSSISQAIVCALVPTSGAGMSRCGPEHLLDLVHERAGDRLDLLRLELARVDVHAALGAAEGDVGDRRLPGHQLGQRAHLVEVDLGVEADAALVGPAGAVVLHAVAGEDVDLAVG